jgi:hypothetical protein
VRPSYLEAIERRRRNWRIGLITIIVITIPFYCVGIFLWGTAPQRAQGVTGTPSTFVPSTATPSLTPTPDGGIVPSITALPITVFPNTPFPTFGPPPTETPTRFLSPTPTFIIPTQIPPTQPPPPPLITDTPLPFEP